MSEEKKRPSPPSAEWDSIDVNVKSTLAEELESIHARLLPQGYEFNNERVGYRVMMFRRGSKHWTQGYTNSDENSTIRFTGPEIGALVGRHLQPLAIHEVKAFRAPDGSLHESMEAARAYNRAEELRLAEKELKNYFLNTFRSYLADRNFEAESDKDDAKELRIRPRDLAHQIACDIDILLPLFRRIHGDGE